MKTFNVLIETATGRTSNRVIKADYARQAEEKAYTRYPPKTKVLSVKEAL